MNRVSKRKQMKLALGGLFICLCIFSFFSNTAHFPDIAHEDSISCSVISSPDEPACPLLLTKTNLSSFQPKSSARASDLFVSFFSSDGRIKIRQTAYILLFVPDIFQSPINKFLFHTIQKATLF